MHATVATGVQEYITRSLKEMHHCKCSFTWCAWWVNSWFMMHSEAALKKTSRPMFINNDCNCLQSHKERLWAPWEEIRSERRIKRLNRIYVHVIKLWLKVNNRIGCGKDRIDGITKVIYHSLADVKMRWLFTDVWVIISVSFFDTCWLNILCFCSRQMLWLI